MDYSLLIGIHEEDRLDSDDDLDADCATNGRSEFDDSADDSPSSPAEDNRNMMMRSNSVTSGEVLIDGERFAIESKRGEPRLNASLIWIYRILFNSPMKSCSEIATANNQISLQKMNF